MVINYLETDVNPSELCDAFFGLTIPCFVMYSRYKPNLTIYPATLLIQGIYRLFSLGITLVDTKVDVLKVEYEGDLSN